MPPVESTLDNTDIPTDDHDSDSSYAYPDQSETNSEPSRDRATQPLPFQPQPETPTVITEDQYTQWLHSQLPWTLFRLRIPTLNNIPLSQHGPPHILRVTPNFDYMNSPRNPLAGNGEHLHRITEFLETTTMTWTDYVNTLPLLYLRRVYFNMPPANRAAHILPSGELQDHFYNIIPKGGYPYDSDGHPKTQYNHKTSHTQRPP
jgi:hypothetical protein